MGPVKSPHPRTTVATGEQIANGRELARMTQGWMERHRDAFFELLGYVRTLQSQERAGRIRDRVAVFCMENGIDVGDGAHSFGNDYWAGVTRYMALVDQSLVGSPIRFNDSDIDCYGLLPVSYLPDLGKDFDYELR